MKNNFNIALAGQPTSNTERENLLNHLYTTFRVVQKEVEKAGGTIRFISSLKVFNDFWQDFAKKSNCNVKLVDAKFDLSEKVRSADVLVSTLRNMTDFADMILMVWDENTESQGGIPWEIMRISHQKDIPCIWFSAEENKPYWAQQVYYGKYSKENLTKYINRVYAPCFDDTEKEKEGLVGFIKIGERLYSRFLNKFKSPSKTASSFSDAVMEEDYIYEDSDKERNILRKNLLKNFSFYDKRAIEYSEKYTASIYIRTILPMFSTLLVAIGFYIESVMSFFFNKNVIGISIWALISAIGFALYLFVNIFVYIISKNPSVNLWHSRFIKNRTVAEVLRVMVHFLPLGIFWNHASSFGRYDNMTKQEQEAYYEIHKILRSNKVCTTDFTEKGKGEILQSAYMLCDDQIVYLQRTKERYKKVIIHLKKWSTIIFSISTILLFVRTVFQILYSLKVFDFLGGVSLGEGKGDALSFTTGMLNLLALLLPAWGNFFITKLQLCNFENLYNTYDVKEEGLVAMKRRITELKCRTNVPVSTIYDAADELVDLLLKETKLWGNLMSKKKFTKLS